MKRIIEDRRRRRTLLQKYTPVLIDVDTGDPVIAHIVSDKIHTDGVYIVRVSSTGLTRGIYPDRINTTDDSSAWMEAAYLAEKDGSRLAGALYDTALELRAGRSPLTPQPGPFLVVG
jgi:hypothetical protein